MPASLKKLIDHKDYEGIWKRLSENPRLANEDMPYSSLNKAKAHPLHRICDGVFSGKYTDEEAVKIADIFLKHGARINGQLADKKDSPLIAASSLHADRVALFYIDRGADIHHAGTHGGTALHWAAWCGRDVVVERLIREGADVNKRCIDFKSTPLFWAVQSVKKGTPKNLHRQLDCVKMLVKSGADTKIPNGGGQTVFELLTDDDTELRAALD